MNCNYCLWESVNCVCGKSQTAEDLQALVRSIKSNVTWVYWKAKRKAYGTACLCDICHGIMSPFHVKITLLTGQTICSGCRETGLDMMRII